MDDPIAEFIDWYRSRPIFTKSVITISFLLAFALKITNLTYMQLFYTFENAISNGQLWRTITSFLFLGDLSFSFAAQAFLSYTVLYYAQNDIYEREQYADFIMLVLFNFWSVLFISSLYDLYFLSGAFLMALLYVQSQFKPFQQIDLFLNTRVPVKYFVWVYLGLNVLMGHSFVGYLVGLLVGFCYVQLKTRLKQKYGDFWPTPQVLKRIVKQVQDRWGRQQESCAYQGRFNEEEADQEFS